MLCVIRVGAINLPPVFLPAYSGAPDFSLRWCSELISYVCKESEEGFSRDFWAELQSEAYLQSELYRAFGEQHHLLSVGQSTQSTPADMAADGKDKEKVPVTEILEEDDEFEVRRKGLGRCCVVGEGFVSLNNYDVSKTLFSQGGFLSVEIG